MGSLEINFAGIGACLVRIKDKWFPVNHDEVIKAQVSKQFRDIREGKVPHIVIHRMKEYE